VAFALGEITMMIVVVATLMGWLEGQSSRSGCDLPSRSCGITPRSNDSKSLREIVKVRPLAQCHSEDWLTAPPPNTDGLGWLIILINECRKFSD
jgi:hypothetical protein